MYSPSSPELPYRSSIRFAAMALQFLAMLCVATNQEAISYAQTQDTSLATVNGRSVTRKEVDSLIVAQTLPLEEKLFALRKAALENLITRRVLEDEAEKRGISVSELRKELASGDVQITPARIEEAYAENASFFASMSPDEAKERLRLDLETQARMQNYREALKKLRASAKIELFLDRPRVSAGDDDSFTSPSLGPKNASITLIEYSDFECPYCREVQAQLKQLIKLYNTQIRLVFKHLPLQIHAQAFPAAQAAFCAGEQGQFWEFHDALFSSYALNLERYKTIASSLNLDLSNFVHCLSSETAGAAVRKDINEATRLGISSTPTFLMNGKLMRGVLAFPEFKALVEQELKVASMSRSQQPQPARKD